MVEADRFGDLIIIRKNGQLGTYYPITDHIFIGRYSIYSHRTNKRVEVTSASLSSKTKVCQRSIHCSLSKTIKYLL